MQLNFPDNFFFGTSTAAYQIETAFEHDWLGVKAMDGYLFERTSDHEKRFKEDAEIIAYCAPNYRMSLMWSKLQRAPYAELHRETVAEYRAFLDDLKTRGVKVMMVLHHFTNPLWFSQNGNWEKTENVALWVDFSKKVVDEFGEYVSYWNTFNEPNVYVSNGWVLGQFPPFKTSLLGARSAIKNMGLAHHMVYDYIKAKFPEQPVGISHNTVIFSAENVWGYLPAKISDRWFMDYLLKPFTGKLDFFGLSYYAKISHDPQPITYIDTPAKMEKLGKPHDDMWEYYPNGLKECIERYWNKYRLPVIITESGICTADENKQIAAMKDYVKIVHDCLQKGIDIRGYYWWSTFDNFEWNLGPTFCFGLYETDLKTKDRRKRAGADVFHGLAYERRLEMQ
jgi:beta-glucosidase